MSILRLKYIIPFLLITVLAVGGVRGFYWFVEKQIDTGASSVQKNTAPEERTIPRPAPAKVEKVSDASAITRRNLFASRAAAPVENQNIKQLQVEPSQLAVVLMGTVTGTDGEERAIIYDKKERKQEMYQVGDFLQQAAVKQISRGKVIITLKGRDEMLDISDARDVKVPQYKKPGPPVTTSRRVVGRPDGNAAAAQQTASAEASEGANGAETTPQKPNIINSNKAGVIIKGRIAEEQSEQAD